MVLSAFILGLVGSLHCAVMCGPLAMLVRSPRLLASRLFYNAGRIATYMLLGGIVGLFGAIVNFGSAQKIASVGIGLTVLLVVMIPSTQRNFTLIVARATSWVKTRIGWTFKSNSPFSAFFTGIFNGFLPCGMVYAALVVALVQPTVLKSMMVMGLFGIGTVPMLLITAYSMTMFTRISSVNFAMVQKVLLIALALILIWRGVEVDLGSTMLSGIYSPTTECVP